MRAYCELDEREAWRSLPSRREKIRSERGNLYVAVTFDEYDRPFEVFGHSSEPDPLDFVESDLVA